MDQAMDSKRGSQSFYAPPLAGMTKTSTSVFHETDRGNCRTTSTCVFQLTVREGFCRGISSDLEGRTELGRKRDETLMWGVVENCKGRERAVSCAARGLEDVPPLSMKPIYDTDLLNSSSVLGDLDISHNHNRFDLHRH